MGNAAHWRGNTTLYVLASIPIAQMITVISVERGVGRARDRTEHVSVSILPRRHGGAL